MELPAFSSAQASYEAFVLNTVDETTVTVSTTDPGARYQIMPPDSDGQTDGHQVDLVDGLNLIVIETSASDGETTDEYRVSIVRPATKPFGWLVIPDFKELSPANGHIRAIWSDGETMWATFIGDKVRAYDLATMEHLPDRDFGTAGNRNANGIWSDGEIVAVSDNTDDKIYVYKLASGTRRIDLEFNLSYYNDDSKSYYNDDSKGLWSDGETLWVVDFEDDMVYAYHWRGARHGERHGAKEFRLERNNGCGAGLWSDGETMWVSDDADAKIYAYSLSPSTLGNRVSSLDFDTPASEGNHSPKGIWSNGAVMWVTDNDDVRVYAYNMPASPSLSSLSLSGIDFGPFVSCKSDYDVRIPSGGPSVTTVTATGFNPNAFDVTITPADSDLATAGHQVEITSGTPLLITATLTHKDTPSLTRTYTVSVLKVAFSTLSDDASLSGLSLGSDVDIGLFDSEVLSYEAYVNADTTRVTVEATPNENGATVTIDPSDADTITSGHQVDLDPNTNVIDVTVHSTDGEAEREYTISVVRDAYLSSIELLDQNGVPLRLDEIDPRISRYTAFAHSSATGITLNWTALGTGVAVTSNKVDTDSVEDGVQFELTPHLNIVELTAEWTDGTDTLTNVYTIEIRRSSAAAFRRDYARDIVGIRVVGVNRPRGIWSDDTTMWIAQDNFGVEGESSKLFAFTLTTVSHQPADDIDLSESGSNAPQGLWSDGTDVWVTDRDTDKAHAISLSTKESVPSKDFSLKPDIRYSVNPAGIWSDSSHIWFVDNSTDYILAMSYSDFERVSDRDIEKMVDGDGFTARGIWSDGSTLWVLGTTSGALRYAAYAYDLVTGARRVDLDFTSLYDFDIRNPQGHLV